MTRICWWLVDIASRMLAPDECAAVLGDLAESGESCGRALRGVIGLVVRRQVALWKDWRPWLAMIGLAGLAAVPLSQITFQLDVALGRQLRTYWSHRVRYDTGLTVGEDIVCIACLALALIAWSWTSGFVLGSLSGRSLWLAGTLFYLVVLDSFWARLLIYGDVSLQHVSVPWIVVHALAPLSIARMLFLLASLWGVSRGLRPRSLGFPQVFLLTLASAILTALAAWTSGWYETAQETWSGGLWHVSSPQTRLLPLALLSWPVVYILATTSWRSRRDKDGGAIA